MIVEPGVVLTGLIKDGNFDVKGELQLNGTAEADNNHLSAGCFAVGASCRRMGWR